MSEGEHIDVAVRRAAGLASAAAEWIDDHGAPSRPIGQLANARVSAATVRLQRLPQAAGRRAGLMVVGADGRTGDAIIGALTGHAEGSMVLGGGDVRLPASGGVLPPDDRLGPGLVIRYSSERLGQSGGSDAVGRLLAPVHARAKRATATSVRIDILSYAELIAIFACAYHTHLRGDGGPRQQADVRAALEEVRASGSAATVEAGLSSTEVWEIRNRLERAFNGHVNLEVLAACGYWQTFAALAPRAARQTRRRLASFLWGGLADFDAYFALLSDALDSLNHSSEVICAADALSDRRDGIIATAHPETVLAASTMLQTGTDLAHLVEVRTRHAGAIRLSRPVVAAIASEISVDCEAAVGGGLRDCDVLQAPVARVVVPPRLQGGLASRGLRTATTNVSAEGSRGGTWIAAAILEAKTLHLAERLIDRREADGLVAVVQPDRSLPLALAPVLSRWVGEFAGRSPQERDANGGAFVLAAVADGVATDQSALHWSSLDRFWASFAPECSWLDAWGQGSRFDRVVLLVPRRPSPGMAGRGVVSLTARALTRIDAGDAAASSSLDRSKIRQATLALDEALSAEDGGLRYLVQTIAGLQLKRLRNRQLAREVRDVRKSLADTLRRSYLAGHADFDHDWRRRSSLEMQAWLRAQARAPTLGRLVHTLLPNQTSLAVRLATELSHLYAEAGVDGAGPVVGLEPDQAAATADRIARTAVTGWIDGLLAWSSSDRASSLSGGMRDLDQFIEEIVIAAVRVDLASRIASRATKALVAGARDRGALVGRLTREAAEVFSSHVSELGFAAQWSTRHPRRPGVIGAPLFDRTASPGGGSDRVVAERLATQYGDDYCEAFPAMVEENIAAARIMRMDERDLRELAELAQQLEVGGNGSVT